MTGPATPQHERRAEIEGLRAVAVALVLLYHLGVATVGGGFVGVDAFFVVSGYLITGLLIREIADTGGVRLNDFWARRIRRIMPMAIVTLVLTVVVGFTVLEPGRKDELLPVALGALGFCANIVLFYRTDDYLGGATLPSPLQHYWSLGVEEQFYLVWPVLVWGCSRLFRGRWRFALSVVCIGLLAVSLVESVRVSYSDHGAGYYLPQTRVWEILVGAVLALVAARLPRVLAGIAGWAGLVAIFGAALLFDEETVFPGSLALVPVLGAAAVILAGDSPWGPHRVLRLRPLQAIGRWSFSLYLLHFPIIVLVEARFGVLSNLAKVAVAVVVVALSALTYRLVEQPVRWLPWLSRTPWRTIVAGVGVMSVLTGVAIMVNSVREPSAEASPGFVVPSGYGTVETTAVAGSAEITSGRIDESVDASAGQADGTTTTAAPPPVKPVRALLLGDSTMAELRWFEQGRVALAGFDYVLDAEACRRLAYKGCEGREGRTPQSARWVVEHLTESFDVIVVQAGYHGAAPTFEREFSEFVDAAHRTGARLVFLTLKESLRFPAAGTQGTRSVYTTFNEMIRRMEADGSLGEVTIADWNLFSYTHPEWFRPDGIHTNIIGTVALGWFISRTVAEVFDNPCPFDGTYPCVVPQIADPQTDYLALFAVQYTDTQCYEDGPRRRRVCETDRRMK